MRQTSEAWEKIFAEKKFDLTQNLHFIEATEIEKISGVQARIMAKVDFSKDLPPVFSRNGYFLLPVQNGKYAIVRGNGFHALEERTIPKEYVSKIKFHLTTAGRGLGEMQYLDYSFNTGALEEIVGVGPLYQSIRGREYSREFSFNVSDTRLDVKSVQIETDSGLESESSIVLLEAKVKTPEDFIIRQLYYPYRNYKVISPDKKIVPVFFTYEPKEQTYNFWIYKFVNDDDYNSIQLERKQAVKIIAPTGVDVSDLSPGNVVTKKDLVPQANDLDKVLELVFKVNEGMNHYQTVAQHFGFDERQSSYYREAAEALGLVVSEAGKYTLTDTGKELVSLPTLQRHIYFAKLLADFHLIRESLSLIQSQKKLSKEDVEKIIASRSTLSGTTIGRRANSLWAWLKWIGTHTGAFTIQEDGTLSESK